MKKHNEITLLAFMALVLTAACTTDELPAARDMMAGQRTVLRAVVDDGNGNTTRSTVHGTWNGTEVLPLSINGTLKKYRLTSADGTMTPVTDEDSVYWTSSTEEKTFTGWYTGDGTYRDKAPAQWTPAADQSNGALQTFDFLYAPPQTLTWSPDGVYDVKFYHQLARVTVNVKLKHSSYAVQSVKLGNGNVLVGARFTAPTDSPYGSWRALTGSSYKNKTVTMDETLSNRQYSALLIPQALSEGTLITVTAGGRSTTYTGALTAEAGHEYVYDLVIYPEPPQLGDIYYSDGTYSAELNESKTPIGIVAYVAANQNDPICEGKQALVLSLKNATTGAMWTSTNAQEDVDDELFPNVEDETALSAETDAVGKTAWMAAQEYYYAGAAADNYNNKVSAPEDATRWFLPTTAQWQAVLATYGATPVFSTFFDIDMASIAAINEKMAACGTYDRLDLYSRTYYWTSSENSDVKAWALNLYKTKGIRFLSRSKELKTQHCVRTMLAF